MAEPFAKPNKEQMKKALVLYGDPVLHWATNKAVETLQENLEERNYWREFYSLTRLVIINWNVATAFNIVELASEDLADKKNPKWMGGEFKVPIIKKTKQERVMISKEWKSG